MPRQIPKNDQNDFSSFTSYGTVFQSPSDRFNRDLANLEMARQKQEVIRGLERYQQKIKDRRDTQEKFKKLLNRGDLSPFDKSDIIKRLKSLKAELEHHQAKFESLVNSDPSFQAHFGFQISLASTTHNAFS